MPVIIFGIEEEHLRKMGDEGTARSFDELLKHLNVRYFSGIDDGIEKMCK